MSLYYLNEFHASRPLAELVQKKQKQRERQGMGLVPRLISFGTEDSER
jgi:hypothetical protein